MTMRKLSTCFSAITVMLIFLQNHLVASLSPIHQKTALFQFQQSLIISAPTDCYYESYSDSDGNVASYPKTMNWSMSSDHCTWEGVSCDHKTGDVIGLDLSCSQLEGAILPNSTLFQLSHLYFLNLSHNHFSLSNQFPQEFGSFAKGLTHLNLSRTLFSGRVPSGISHLYKLVSLDLSYNFDAKLENEAFKSILQNLTQLRVLNLLGVNISSVLPVNLSTSLRVLNLISTGLHGVLPQEVFHLPNLEVLWLTGSSIDEPGLEVEAVLPKVKWGSSGTLQHLLLVGINFHQGGIPDSIGFLESLATLDLSRCNLSGPIPRSIGNLGQLTHLDLSGNNLNGPIPTLLANLTNLRYLYLSQNNFTGPFVAHFKGLNTLFLSGNGNGYPSLEVLDVSDNGLTGLLPPWLFNHPSLEVLYLDHNGFTGPLPSFVAHFKGLLELDVSHNGLTGLLPPWLFNHPSLGVLSLSYNGFTGQLYESNSSKSQLRSFDCRSNLLFGRIPQSFSQLVNLTHLDISNNEIEGEIPYSFSQLVNLAYLDISNNEIQGEIPHWIGSMGMYYLNFSYNRLTGGLEQLPWNNIQYLDLQSNKLNGSLPTLICNSSFLEILNLSNNTLSGVLPICQTYLTSLMVFDLRMNKIQGHIPATLSNFRNLETINLNGNRLQGKIPSSFAEFDSLKVLDLGNNEMNDTFPECLKALPYLQVLVLKSNKFHGLINKSSKIKHPFPSLRIFDLSYNEFSGPLPAMYFQNFNAMMIGNVNEREATYIRPNISTTPASYSDSTILVIKGVEIQFVRILTVLTTIDLSRNNFEGEIPEYIGKLILLRYLNLSHNHLTGHIPSSIGNLSMLESLDLSSNQLEGEIPSQLTSINTLERLNLSCNQLDGQIPKGPQFNTFDNDSYVGNIGLCGFPLSKECEPDHIEMQKEGEDDDYFFSGFTWEAVVIGYGCGVVPAFIIGNLMLLAGKPKWFAGIIARELGLKVRRMEIRMR